MATRRKAGGNHAGLAPLLEPEWESDYADILDCALWHQNVEVEDVCAANSGDSWNGFVSRHGTHGFDYDWEAECEKAAEAEKARKALEHQRAIADRRRRIEEKLEADRQWWETTRGAKRIVIERKPDPEKRQHAERQQVLWQHYAEFDRAARHASRPAPTNVEPWFDPNITPTPDDLKQIELYASNYFKAALRAQGHGIGGFLVSPILVVCDRNADTIAAKLYRVASVRMPGHFSHMSVSSEANGKEVSIDIWFRRT